MEFDCTEFFHNSINDVFDKMERLSGGKAHAVLRRALLLVFVDNADQFAAWEDVLSALNGLLSRAMEIEEVEGDHV